MMKTTATLFAGLVLATAAPAFAADLGVDYGSPVAYGAAPTSGFDWEGNYAGVALGYGFADQDVSSGGTSGTADTGGVTGSVYVGRNFRVAPNFVAGVEGELGFAPEGDFNVGGTAGRIDTTIGGNVRGRVGYTFGNTMVYGTGGLAVTRGEADFNGGEDTNTHFGYVLGAGVEAALSDKITARAEYLYTDTSDEEYRVGGTTVRTDIDQHTLRVGAGYKF